MNVHLYKFFGGLGLMFRRYFFALKACIAITILDLMSVVDLESLVITLPKYLNDLTGFIFIPFMSK